MKDIEIFFNNMGTGTAFVLGVLAGTYFVTIVILIVQHYQDKELKEITDRYEKKLSKMRDRKYF